MLPGGHFWYYRRPPSAQSIEDLITEIEEGSLVGGVGDAGERFFSQAAVLPTTGRHYIIVSPVALHNNQLGNILVYR